MKYLSLTILLWGLLAASLVAQNSTNSSKALLNRAAHNASTTALPTGTTVFNTGTLPVVSFTTTNVSCNAATDGCATAVVSGSTGSLGYLWSNGSTTSTICGLGAGFYTVTVTDTMPAGPPTLDTVYFENFEGTHNWNLATSTGTNGVDPNVWEVNDTEGGVAPTGCGVSNNGDNTLHITCTSLLCGTLITGALYNATEESNTRAESPVFSTVGYSNITFTFDYIANGDGLNDNASLLYNDGSGWQVLDPSLKSNVCTGGQGEWTAYSVTLPASCDNNPSVQIAFNWTNNADNIGTDPSIAVNNTLLTSMGTGGTVQICTVVNDTTVIEPFTLAVSLDTVGNVVCDGNSNGFINISVSGGTAPLTYIWSNGDTTQDITNLIDTTYSVTITDANACTTVGGAVVSTLGFIEAVVDSAMNVVGCAGDSTGAVYITATGDTSTTGCTSNIVALNEILYRPVVRNGQDPNTGEYIELIGPAGADISCYVLTDGDWTITIPQGTMIPPDGFFTIGNDSVWGAGTFDLDAENCNCFTEGTGGSALLILTDGGEYVALYDGAGTFLQGVIYSSPSVGNTPNGSVEVTIGTAGCPTSVTVPAVAAFETAPGGFASGTSIIRSPDGSGAWIPQVGGSLNACNSFGSGSTGNGSVTYLWNNGDTTQDISNLPAGTYTVTATNTYGCTATTSYTVTEAGVLAATTLATPVACAGDTTGMIDLTVTNGTMPYTFNWSNGATTEDIGMLPSGNYCVTVTDSSGCTAIVCDTIEEPFFSIPVDTFYICAGDSVQIQVNSNATSIQWTPSASLSNDTIINPFASPTSTTTYTVTALTPTSGSNLVVNGDFEAGNTGFTTSYAYGGSMGGAYVIDVNANLYNGQHSGFDHTTGSGNYLIADAAPGSVNVWCQTVTVTPNTAYDFSAWANNIVRPSSNYADPSIELLINGVVVYNSGAIPENPDVWVNCSATWNSGANATATLCIRAAAAGGLGHDFGLDDISFLPQGGSSCTRIDSVVVIVDSLSISLATVNPPCNGDSTGSITTTAAGSYSYLWNTGDTTANLTNLPAGTYTLTVSSASCQDTLSVSLTEPAVLVGTTVATDIACVGDTTGAIDLTAVGGTAPYTFNWSNGAITEDIGMLLSGTYCVTITDSSACTAIVCDTIEDPFFTIPVDTFYICTGDSVQIQVNTNITNLSWTPSGTLSNDTISNPFASPTSTTTYVVSTVGTACTTMDSIVVIVNSINLSLASINPLCNGDTTGSITTSTAGTYNYLWNTGDTTANLTNLAAGTYLLTVSLGSCQDTLSATLTEPTAIALSLSSSTNPSCNGDSTGSIDVINSGGTAPYTYFWSNTATTQNLSNIPAGTYNLTLTDGNGCTAPLSVALTEPSAISVSYSTTNVSCGGTNDGTASVTPTGGTPSYTYLWDVTASNQTTVTATNLSSNTYSVTVTDSEGCTAEANGIFVNPGVPVDSNDVPLVVVTGMLDCDLNPIGALEINTTNTYTYLWSNGATSMSVTGLPAGMYTVTVTNGLGCTYVQTASVTSPFVPTINPFIVSLGSTSTTVNSGTIVDINGGNDQSSQGVTYNWTNPSTNVTITTATAHATTAMANSAGSYLLTLTATANDSTACQDTASVILNVESIYSGMPNAFTPNDDGVNDLYRPIGLNAEDIITFRVYNRWGQEVYNGDDLDNMGWDGRFQGVEQPTEAYIFLLEYKLGANSEAKAHKGEFTLIR